MDHSMHDMHITSTQAPTMGGMMNHEGHNNMHTGHDMGRVDDKMMSMETGNHAKNHQFYRTSSDDHSSMMMMQMWFTASTQTTILFKEWKTEEIWQMVLSCVFWFIVAFLYEVLKAVRQEIIIRDVSHRKCTLPVSSAVPPLDEQNINAMTNNNITTNNHNNHCVDHPNGMSIAPNAQQMPVDSCPCIEASRSRMAPPAQDLVEIQMIPPHGFMATSWRYQMLSKCHLVQTLLHIIQMTISYLLMLVVMTFNVWLFLAIILGFGVGYFVCGWWHCGPVVDPNEHCH